GMNVLKEDGRIAGELHCLMLVLKMVSIGIRHICNMSGDCFSAHLSTYEFLMVLPGMNIDNAKELGKKSWKYALTKLKLFVINLMV
ncbi:MAG: hypothetical protein RMK35_06275, partial [Aquificaceae bacterium]|nr:hypothetical protein [Aquificaceae bacterium]